MGYYRVDRPYARVENAADGRLVWYTNLDDRALEAFKGSVPYFWRQWDKQRKAWLVEPEAFPELKWLAAHYHDVSDLQQPRPLQRMKQQFDQTVEIEYIGAPKEVGSARFCSGKRLGERWYDIIFLDDVLREWFEPSATNGKETPGSGATLYSLLGLKPDAPAEAVKKGFRVASMTWHPDKNPNDREAAHDMFIRIKEAYDILSNQQLRARYDAFLALEKFAPKASKPILKGGTWRPPIRCGRLHLAGYALGSYRIVTAVLGWQDIVDQFGRTMISEWDMAAQAPRISWI